MQHDVVAVVRIARPTDCVVPRDHNHTVAPRLAYETRGGPGDLAAPGRPGELGNEAVRIHEHRPERRIAWTLEMEQQQARDRKSTRLNSSHSQISYAVFCLKKKKQTTTTRHLYKTPNYNSHTWIAGIKRSTHSYCVVIT